MRTLTANALTKIAQLQGNEPRIHVEIEWTPGSITRYADDKLLEVGALKQELRGDNVQIDSFRVTLDDTDGTIKAILDTTDLHKANVSVYQSYVGLDDADRFLLTKGQISTPFIWGEGDRQLTLEVLSTIESFEVGFSPEEGQLDFITDDFVGKPWPLCFGDVKYVPAQRVKQQPVGTLLQRFCVPDYLLEVKMEEIAWAYQSEYAKLRFFSDTRSRLHALHPRVDFVLAWYVDVIKREDDILAIVLFVWQTLEAAKIAKQKDPGDKTNIPIIEAAFEQAAFVSNSIQQEKQFIEATIAGLLWCYDAYKQATLDEIQANNNMRQLYAEYLDVSQELCRQQESALTCVPTEKTEEFGSPTDVSINNLRFRVTFDSNLQMCQVAGPLPLWRDLDVAAWVPEPSPCHDLDGINMFYLADNPPQNLVGSWLLLEKKQEPDTIVRDGEKEVLHVVEVERQEGQKVYYKLVKWNNSGVGQPKGVDLASVIQTALYPPEGWKNGPLNANSDFSTLFANSSYAFQPDNWNLPELKQVREIVAGIPLGVNQEELIHLIELVYTLPFDNLRDLILIAPTARDTFTIIGEDVAVVRAVAGEPLKEWFVDYTIPKVEWPDSLLFEAEAGAEIRAIDDQCEIFVCNLLPSTIKAVHAYRTDQKTGFRTITPVPESYYTKNESQALGTYTLTTIVTKKPLSSIAGEGWEDQIYVTMDCSVGPNPVDVIQWLVETYTDGSVNASSFAAAHALVTNYPVNFFLGERPNVLEEVYRIAWESRMSVSIREGEFFLKYVAIEPSVDATITAADLIAMSRPTISYTETENITTRLIATNKAHYLPETEFKEQVFRHNVKKYGLQSSTENFHTLAHRELVEKSATFWLIRNSNTWKRVTFTTHHKNIRLEPLDCVLLSFPQVDNVKAVVESIEYDPNENEIHVVALVPVRAGENTVYPFYWPAGLDSGTAWPTAAEITKGYAGGYGPGAGVVGTIEC